jgi:hypothetical protein
MKKKQTTPTIVSSVGKKKRGPKVPPGGRTRLTVNLCQSDVDLLRDVPGGSWTKKVRYVIHHRQHLVDRFADEIGDYQWLNQ